MATVSLGGDVGVNAAMAERQPWVNLGVSRATWYRRFRGAKTGGESLGAKCETRSQYR